jgi:hypothetical protein
MQLFSGFPGKFWDRYPITPRLFPPECFLMTNPVRSGNLLLLSPALPDSGTFLFYIKAMGVSYLSTSFTTDITTLYTLCFSKCGSRITNGTKRFATAFENRCLDIETTSNLTTQCCQHSDGYRRHLSSNS